MNNCQSNCGCKFEVDSSCVRYTAVNLGTTLINVGDTIETTIIKIDQAITNLQQTIINNSTNGSPLQISGPINNVVKFGPPSNPLLPSQTIDDGTSIGINATPDSSSKVLIETSANQSGLKVSSLNNGKEAITASSQAVGSIINKGIISFASGSTTSNIGVETSTTGSANINVGISASAFGATNNYSAQLRDGSETTTGGKFLKDTGSGKANWNYIYLSDIQDYQAPNQYALPIATSTILGGIKVGNGLSITNQGVLSSNIGQGTLNYIAKFTPDGYSIDDSIMQDNGNSIGVGAAPNSQTKHYVYSLDKRIAGFAETEYTGGNPAIGFGARAKGTNSGENRGAEFEASNSTNSNIGIYVSASDANPYIGIFQDGSQTVEGGRVLRDTGNGYAKWSSIVTDVTHAQLVGYVNGSQLTPGTYYRITDYQTIYEQPDFTEVNTPVITPIIKTGPTQPIIVLALKNNVLSEQAYQEAFPKDTIKYRLVYNTKRTNTPTKGRIYERIDEYNNRTDFDHRNVLFKRYKVDPTSARPSQFFLYEVDTVLYHYPVADNCIYTEHLIFPQVQNGNCFNNHISGNFESNSYFDLPNIVITEYALSNNIYRTQDSTFRVLDGCELYYVIGSTIYRIIGSNLRYIQQVTFFGGEEIGNSKFENWANLSITSFSEPCEILYSEISYFLGNFDFYNTQSFKPFYLVNLGSINNSNLQGISRIAPTSSIYKLINPRNDAKLYTGSSVFLPNSVYNDVILKEHSTGEIISRVSSIFTDSNGKIKLINLNLTGGISSGKSPVNYGNHYDLTEVYFYFETTITNELGKVPSNISEQVVFSPFLCVDPYSSLAFSCSYSTIKQITDSSIGTILNSDIKQIHKTSSLYIEKCFGTELNHVRTKKRNGSLKNIKFNSIEGIEYNQINNCYFNNVENSTFGYYFGGPDASIATDSFVSGATSKSTMVLGNIFNSNISDANFGDYIQGNIFDCQVNNINIPNSFSNNHVKSLSYLGSNPNFLNKYKELKESSIKCEITSYFKTMSELGYSTTLGSVIQYPWLSVPTSLKVELKLFRVEQNYISTIPRLWYVFYSQRLSPNPYPYNRTNFEQMIENQITSFRTGLVFLNNSTLLGESKNNTKKIRDLGQLNVYQNLTFDLEKTISNPNASSYFQDSPNLTQMSIPTKEDLELIYSLNLIPLAEKVWSSSDIDANSAWAFNFATGQSEITDKSDSCYQLYIIDLIGAEELRFNYVTSSGNVSIDINDLTA